MSVLEGTGRKVSLLRAKRRGDRPVSLVIVADLLRMMDVAVICGTAVLVHGLYLGGSELEHARIYPVATVLAAFAAGMTFHWNGLYQLQGLAAGQLKLGKLAASWSIVVLGLINLVTITAMVAHGHWEELAMHIRAALRNGLSRDEIKEILLQTAIYCGVPSANTAFKTAQQVFHSLDAPATDIPAKDTPAPPN